MAWLVAAGIVVLVTVVAAGRRESLAQRRWISMISAAVGLIAAVGTASTWSAVQWDQLALWAVSPGTGISGFFTAATDDRVRFVITDGMEVTPSRYAVAVYLHLGLPLVALLAFAAALATVRANRRDGLAGPAAVNRGSTGQV